MMLPVQRMHFSNDGFRALSQRRIEGDLQPVPCFTIVQESFRDLTAQHILQTKRLCRQLENIAVILFRGAAFVFDRNDAEGAFHTEHRDAVRIAVEFDRIAFTGETEPCGGNCHRPCDDAAAAFLTDGIVMHTFVHEIAVHRADIFLPLLLDVDERPLPPAEGKMLDAGQHQEFLLRPGHVRSITSGAMPSRASSVMS